MDTQRSGSSICRRLDGKVIVVAGGASGIGAGTVRRLHAEGARLIVGDIDLPGTEALFHQIGIDGADAQAVRCDISDDTAVAALVSRAEREFGGVDGFFANAADTSIAHQDLDALEITLEIFDRTMTVNMRGFLLCTRHALPALSRRGGGAIVYTSSRGAFIGEPTRVAYAMSKAAVHALARHVASRWGKEGIRANAIAPAYIETPATRAMFNDAERQARLDAYRSTRLGVPADIAAMVAMLMSDDGDWINGQVMHVNGGSNLMG